MRHGTAVLFAALEASPQDGIAALQRALDVATRIGSTYLALGCLDGLAAAVSHKHSVKAARLFAASDALRGRAGLPRSAGEQALYQPYIDALEGARTREEGAKVSRQVQVLADVTALARVVANDGAN